MKKVYGIIAIVVLLVFIIVFDPFSSYFQDPQKAFWHEYSPNATDINYEQVINSIDTVELFKINDSTAVYFAITDSDDLLAAQMKCKGNKVQFTGSYALYEKTQEDYTPETGISENMINYFGMSSKEPDIFYAIVRNENIIDKEKYQVHELKANDFDEKVFFVYRFGN